MRRAASVKSYGRHRKERDQHAKTGMIEVATYYHALERAISKYHTSSASAGRERREG
jgi:hypothetical protein